jgi:GAF domain-containing protein
MDFSWWASAPRPAVWKSLLSMLNEAIVRVKEQQSLLQEVCRIAVKEGLFRLAWIGIINPPNRVVESTAQCCYADYFLPQLRFSLDEGPEAGTPTGIAIRKGRYDICNDIAADPRMTPWQQMARDQGFLACGAFPLRVGEEIVGALTLYADQPDFFTAEEVACWSPWRTTSPLLLNPWTGRPSVSGPKRPCGNRKKSCAPWPYNS